METPDAGRVDSRAIENDDDLIFEMDGDLYALDGDGDSRRHSLSSVPLTGSGGELDVDSLGAVLVRLLEFRALETTVDLFFHGALRNQSVLQVAETLSRCACVSRVWHASANNEDLWRGLIRHQWGEHVVKTLSYSERTVSARALYIRSVTSRVAYWGAPGACSEDGGHTVQLASTRTPALQEPDGLQSLGPRQVAAGAGFSCLVSWNGGVVCWGDNRKGQCGVQRTDGPRAEQAVVCPTYNRHIRGLAVQVLALSPTCMRVHACIHACLCSFRPSAPPTTPPIFLAAAWPYVGVYARG